MWTVKIRSMEMCFDILCMCVLVVVLINFIRLGLAPPFLTCDFVCESFPKVK